MTQLSYNEAFDPYHAAFRCIRLRFACEFERGVHFDMLRILDFYLLFPFRIQAMRPFSEHRHWRTISKNYGNHAPYGELPDDVTLFARMEPFQRAAANSLARVGCISAEAWERDEVLFETCELPVAFEERCSKLNESMNDVADVLKQMSHKYDLLGSDGLKRRTGLLEYRYDAV